MQPGEVKQVKSETAAQAERSVKGQPGSRDSLPEPHLEDLGAGKAHILTSVISASHKSGRSLTLSPEELAKPSMEPRQLSL